MVVSKIQPKDPNRDNTIAWLTRLKGGLRTASLQSEAQAEATTLLQKLIPVDTTTSHLPELCRDTREGTEMVGNYLQAAGAKVTYGEELEFPTGSGKFHKPMIAVFYPKDEAKRSRPARVISGHIDNVPVLEENWDGHDPHALNFNGQKYIGRGVIDMKGPVATAAASLATLARHGGLDHLEQPLVLALSSLEEVGVYGVPGLADLLRKENITPHEFMVLEPSEGYVATGGKGSLVEQLTAKPVLHPRGADVWPHQHVITIQSKGGHSSILGGSPADPAFLASTVILPEIQKLREQGLPVEVCAVHYGTASNVVGGDLKLTIGYGGNAEKQKTIEQFLNTGLQPLEKSANKTLASKETKANILLTLLQEVRGLKLGQVNILSEPAPEPEQHYQSFRHDFPASHQNAEALLSAAAEIYAENARQASTRAKGYVIPTFGPIKASVTLLHAGQPDGKDSLTYDMRFPMEATKGSGTIPKVEDLAATLAKNASAVADRTLQRHRVFDLPAYESGLSQRDVENLAHLAQLTGVKKYDSLATHVPNGSDGNRLAYEFPGAIVTDVVPGGFADNIHGINESWSLKHLHAATNFMMEYATMPLLNTRREQTLER